MTRYKKAIVCSTKRHKARPQSGKAVIIGPMGWVIDTGDGVPKVVNEGCNYLGHTEGKDREPDHLGHFLNG